MMFKKGSFEVGGVVYPAAIKVCHSDLFIYKDFSCALISQYDSRFADPFWNSSKQSLSKHLLMILSSWALVCDVWYLPPVTQQVLPRPLSIAVYLLLWLFVAK